MNHCDEGHVSAINNKNGFELVISNYITEKVLYRIRPKDTEVQQDIQERFDAGECPICDEWEYI